jgi:hypothetical protein
MTSMISASFAVFIVSGDCHSPQSTLLVGDFDEVKDEKGFYPDRAAGRNRDHRSSDLPAASCRTVGS